MQSFEQSFTIQRDKDRSERNFTTPPISRHDNYLLETFHQHPHGDFSPTFYNPFEIKHRRRTSRAQLKILEKAFSENPKPSATIRRILAQKLDMTPRGVQIWFQNRRAKAKLQRKKSSVQIQRQNQQQSQESLDEIEEEYNSDTNSTESVKSSENLPSCSSDLSQSSVLFSQFFANVNGGQGVHELNVITSTTKDSHQLNSNNDWSWQMHQQPLNDNAHTVATIAAATAVATSSAQYEQNTTLRLEGESNWLGHNNGSERIFNQQSMRRKSCSASNNAMMMTDMKLGNHQQHAYLSPSWSHSMMPRNKNSGGSGNTSPMALLNNFNKRNFSYDSNSPSMDYYNMQDIHLNNYAHHQQLTPPLTASCSGSTVAGSPISLDNIYNDPVVVSQNGYYSSSSHISSPLSATTLVTEMMPSFV